MQYYVIIGAMAIAPYGFYENQKHVENLPTPIQFQNL